VLVVTIIVVWEAELRPGLLMFAERFIHREQSDWHRRTEQSYRGGPSAGVQPSRVGRCETFDPAGRRAQISDSLSDQDFGDGFSSRGSLREMAVRV
jgi:hypothetical protein